MIPTNKLKKLVESGEKVQSQPYTFVGKMRGTKGVEQQ